MKGQIALEYIIIIGLVLAIILPIVYLSYTSLEDSKSISDVNSAFYLMKNSIDQVFSLSPGSRIMTKIFLPYSYTPIGSSLNLNILTLKFNIPNQDLVISESVRGNIKGNLPPTGGNYEFTFELLDSNEVLVNYTR